METIKQNSSSSESPNRAQAGIKDAFNKFTLTPGISQAATMPGTNMNASFT